MSSDLTKINSRMTKLKDLLNEQLWLIYLLAPLVLIVALIGTHLQPSQKSNIVSKVNGGLGVSAEVSSAELALIVVKPLGELLMMEVYFDQPSKSSHLLRVSSSDIAADVKSEAYKQSFMNKATKQLLARETTKAGTDG